MDTEIKNKLERARRLNNDFLRKDYGSYPFLLDSLRRDNECYFSYEELEKMSLSDYVDYLNMFENKCLSDLGNVKKFNAQKLMLAKTEQEYDFMKTKLWAKTRDMLNKEPDTEEAVLFSILNATVSFTGGMIFSAVRQGIKHQQDIEQIKQAKNEYLTTDEAEQIADNIKANLNAKYPTLDTSDMNASNIIDKMRDAYDTCYVNAGRYTADVKIKTGWENYYIDCKHGLIDNIESTLCQNNYNIPDGTGVTFIPTLVDGGLAASLGALATLAIIFGPYLINKTRFKLMKHGLNKNEKISNVAQLINDYEKAKDDFQEGNISINEFYDIVKDVDAKYNNLTTKKTKSRKNKDDEDAHENALTL